MQHERDERAERSALGATACHFTGLGPGMAEFDMKLRPTNFGLVFRSPQDFIATGMIVTMGPAPRDGCPAPRLYITLVNGVIGEAKLSPSFARAV